MEKIRFGRTGLSVSRTGFGAIPIQRLSFDDAVKLLRKAYESGINLFDTARGYSDSEEKIGKALSDVRKDIIITTKTPSKTREGILSDIDKSLKMLNTDYIDVYQFHNPGFIPEPGDELYDTLVELKKAGKIRFIGFTNHDLALAQKAVLSGNYDTLQFPLSPLSSEAELNLSKMCEEADMGLLAMKALSGGLITKAVTSFVFLRQYKNIVPIWGMEHIWQLDEFIGYENNPPVLDDDLKALIEKDRAELSGSFCRGCGYCLPCPAEIPIPTAARISLLLARSRPEGFITEQWQANMDKIENCIECGHCASNCPYGLDTPSLLKTELVKYREYIKNR